MFGLTAGTHMQRLQRGRRCQRLEVLASRAHSTFRGALKPLETLKSLHVWSGRQVQTCRHLKHFKDAQRRHAMASLAVGKLREALQSWKSLAPLYSLQFWARRRGKMQRCPGVHRSQRLQALASRAAGKLQDALESLEWTKSEHICIMRLVVKNAQIFRRLDTLATLAAGKFREALRLLTYLESLTLIEDVKDCGPGKSGNRPNSRGSKVDILELFAMLRWSPGQMCKIVHDFKASRDLWQVCQPARSERPPRL